MKLINKKNNKNSGYAVLELLFYISIFAVLSIVVINSMITMTKAFKETTIQAEFMQGGAVMERMSRETRQAFSISSINTLYPNDLVLNTQNSSGTNETMEFRFVSPYIELWENSTGTNVRTGFLNPPNISVTGVTFTQITTAKGSAVKMSLTIQATDDTLNRSLNFYDTVVLRGNY
jgi:Tfp pilus assembly protein PilE